MKAFLKFVFTAAQSRWEFAEHVNWESIGFMLVPVKIRVLVTGTVSAVKFNHLMFRSCVNSCWLIYRILCIALCQEKTSQVTYVTMVPRMGNETLRPLGVATGNALSVTQSEDTYEKTPPVGRRQPMTSLPACHNISAAGRIHHQLLRLKLASEAWSKA